MRTGAWSQRLRPLGQHVLLIWPSMRVWLNTSVQLRTHAKLALPNKMRQMPKLLAAKSEARREETSAILEYVTNLTLYTIGLNGCMGALLALFVEFRADVPGRCVLR